MFISLVTIVQRDWSSYWVRGGARTGQCYLQSDNTRLRHQSADHPDQKYNIQNIRNFIIIKSQWYVSASQEAEDDGGDWCERGRSVTEFSLAGENTTLHLLLPPLELSTLGSHLANYTPADDEALPGVRRTLDQIKNKCDKDSVVQLDFSRAFYLHLRAWPWKLSEGRDRKDFCGWYEV